MERAGKKARSGRYPVFPVIAACILLLCGCGIGSVNAGTKPKLSYPTENGTFGEADEILWFNGLEEKSETVTVSTPILEGELPDGIPIPNSVKNATPNLCSRWAVQVVPDPGDIRPVYVCDAYGHALVRGDEEYKAGGYALGDGWYLFVVPNGAADFSVCVGNRIFSAGNRSMGSNEEEKESYE